MADAGGPGPRAGRRAAALGGGRSAADWAGHTRAALAPARAWLEAAFRAEVDAGRLAPWLAVGFGVGVLVYFAAPSEPSIVAAVFAFGGSVIAARACRDRPVAFAVALGLVSVAAGFAAGCLRTITIEHPVLVRPTGTLTLAGFVEARDATERSDRVVLRVTSARGAGARRVPERVRVSMRRDTAPAVGVHVELRARLLPPLGPQRPGGFDYARNAYFSGLGATGFVLGRARTTDAPGAAPLDIRVYAAIEMLRRRMTERIRTVLPGDIGAVAAALVTGVRDEISPEVNDAMRISGLAHVLSISGLHMVLVVGALLALTRGVLATVPGLALRYPVKKWASVVALAGATGYLILSGAAVPTQRAFLMIAIVLVGVLVDRPALTVRTLATAASALLALEPEAILHPSFQMSFAATLALVALYERFAPLLAAPPGAGAGIFARLSDRLGRWILLGALTSLAAGLATTAFAAFHFHRLAPYGLLANVLAMPVISFVIMPAALVSVLLLPFGYDALAWKAMGGGIELMLAIARWVAALPGAEGRVAAFGAGALFIATVGLLVLTIPASRLRIAGLPLIGLALALAVAAPRPDVLVDPDGRVVAVRGADGRLGILDARSNRIAAESWLAADADSRKARDDLARPFVCDKQRCVARLYDGTGIVVVRSEDAFADACREAGLLVTRLAAPSQCAAPLIDRDMLATTGALALRRSAGAWIAEPARTPTSERPWYGRVARPDPAALARLAERRSLPASAKGVAPSIARDDVPTPDLEEDSLDDE